MSNNNHTDVDEFLMHLDGGVVKQKLGALLSEVASAAIDHGRVGNITLNINIEQIGNSTQVEIKHKLSYKRPTRKGDISENNTTSTPMFVGSAGRLTFFQQDQEDFFKHKESEEA